MLPGGASPVLLAVVVAEEEFDWSREFDRANRGVSSIPFIADFQKLLDEFGVRPSFPVDYPVVDDPTASRVVREIIDSGRGELAAHLHPWVTPPYEEHVSVENSYPNNLGPELERDKLAHLLDRLEEVFGQRPSVYQAGRYGIGAETPRILKEAGITIDLSPSPPYDFSDEGGPSFGVFPPTPYWMSEDLLAIPMTGTYVGFLGLEKAHGLYRFATRPGLSWARLPGVLARLGAVERIRLSPEGFTLEDLKKLTRFLLQKGEQVFTFSFHAPSLKPGCTPYVQNQADLDAFYQRCRSYFEWFFGELGGRTATPLELREEFLVTKA